MVEEVRTGRTVGACCDAGIAEASYGAQARRLFDAMSIAMHPAGRTISHQADGAGPLSGGRSSRRPGLVIGRHLGYGAAVRGGRRGIRGDRMNGFFSRRGLSFWGGSHNVNAHSLAVFTTGP